MKKFIGILLILALVMSLSASAFAVTITVARDSTYEGEPTEAGRRYMWYKVFSASYGNDFTGNSGTDTEGNPGGGYNSTTGAPLAPFADTTNPVSYTASADVASKLGEWVAPAGSGSAVWTPATGNDWFKATPIAGSTEYVIEWTNTNTDSATAQAAAQWLYNNGVYENTSGELTFANGKWTAENLDKGYYLIVSVVEVDDGQGGKVIQQGTGTNLVSATTDINIKEKNDYPPLDKTQGATAGEANSNDPQDVKVGDHIYYEVKVTIPLTARENDEILVWDRATIGLTFDNNLAVKQGSNTGNCTISVPENADMDSSWTWARVIKVADGSQGTDVIFTFSMTVNENALVDEHKENESALKFGREGDWTYESIPDYVEYRTYFAGIHKIDPDKDADEQDLEGVEFTLKENGNPFKVKPVTQTTGGVTTTLYYIPSSDTDASSTVVTDAEGMIRIRGLDTDKTYTLTETKTQDGYNMLNSDITLDLNEDTYTVIITDVGGQTSTSTQTSYDPSKTNPKWTRVENKQGKILPSTGGIGTTIFYIIGGVLVVGAGVVLVARKKTKDD